MGGPLDKVRGGTGILRTPEPGMFDAELFQRAFVGFSRTCTRPDGAEEPGLIRSDLMRLARANRADLDGSRRTMLTNIVELGALIDVFGIPDSATGDRYISTAEMRVLFEHGRLPTRMARAS